MTCPRDPGTCTFREGVGDAVTCITHTMPAPHSGQLTKGFSSGALVRTPSSLEGGLSKSHPNSMCAEPTCSNHLGRWENIIKLYSWALHLKWLFRQVPCGPISNSQWLNTSNTPGTHESGVGLSVPPSPKRRTPGGPSISKSAPVEQIAGLGHPGSGRPRACCSQMPRHASMWSLSQWGAITWGKGDVGVVVITSVSSSPGCPGTCYLT